MTLPVALFALLALGLAIYVVARPQFTWLTAVGRRWPVQAWTAAFIGAQVGDVVSTLTAIGVLGMAVERNEIVHAAPPFGGLLASLIVKLLVIPALAILVSVDILHLSRQVPSATIRYVRILRVMTFVLNLFLASNLLNLVDLARFLFSQRFA